MSKSKVVHTCYGCKSYYRVNEDGMIEYLKPFSTRHCDIENPWDCDYFANDGEPRKVTEKGGGVNERD